MDFLFSGSTSGINIFVNSVFPVLFPFAVFTYIMSKLFIGEKGTGIIFSFIACGIGGYPLAAKLLNDRCQQETVSKKEQVHILATTFVTGPGFILGTVGYSFLDNEKAGFIILICHYLSALANGMIFRGERKKPHLKANRQVAELSYSLVTEAVVSSLKAMAIVFAYIVLFMILTQFLDMVLLDFLSINQVLKSMIKGIFEMTIGCNQISMLNISMVLKVSLCNFLISFGGLSVAGQGTSLLTNSKVTFIDILKIKASQGVNAFIFTFILRYYDLK